MTGKTHEDMRKEVMRKLRHGQVLRIRNTDERTPGTIEVRVVAFYPEFVLCQGASYRTCYRYYELWARMQPREKKEIKIPDYIKG